MHKFLVQTQTTSPIDYLFRKPEYPVLCCIEGRVVSATTEERLLQLLSQCPEQSDVPYDVIDVTGEHWAFYPDTMLLSPLTLRKRWTKLQLIRLVNTRSNRSTPDEPSYSERSLSAKRFERVFHDLVEITDSDT